MAQHETIQREFDIVIFGATGYTGQIVVDYMQEQYGQSNLTWAIAGRSREKLDKVDDGRGLNIIEADAQDLSAMEALVQKARVVLTTVGPYARYGSSVVEACAKHGTHYCDLTGEVHWMRDMIDAHQAAAKASGAIIVPTCGFDSIPSDLGVFALQTEMLKRHGVPASQIKYLARETKGGFSGGTADSMMAMMEHAETRPEILEIGAQPYALNDQQAGLDGLDTLQAHYDEDFSSWVAPFVMAPINTRVVRRSNELLNHAYGREFRYEEGMATGDGAKGRLGAHAFSLGLRTFNVLPRFAGPRRLLQKIMPKPGEGPTPEQVEKGFFNIEMLAKHPNDASKNLRLMIHGKKDPGYGATAKMLGESAVCLAQDELGVGGGFWTPASAMGTELLKRLPENADVTFEFAD
ncbi:MAG: short subunit dehydrogenase-like uncharacterized protein [Candidatus Azotimanducaceae bacterium]|jgi:short subunit dehydrogenase-like uncharacterized protein